MEKLIYLLDRPAETAADAFAAWASGPLLRSLVAAGAHEVVVEVDDEAVAPAAGLRIGPPDRMPAAVVSVWVDSANPSARAEPERLIDGGARRTAGFVVTESVPLVAERGPTDGVERTPGFSQVALLTPAAELDRETFLERWLVDHTPVAVELQATSGYVQNVVARTAGETTTPYAAVVSELFPEAAMTDPAVFFDAVGDPALLGRRQQEMFSSVQRFLDLGAIVVLPTSRYRLTR